MRDRKAIILGWVESGQVTHDEFALFCGFTPEQAEHLLHGDNVSYSLDHNHAPRVDDFIAAVIRASSLHLPVSQQPKGTVQLFLNLMVDYNRLHEVHRFARVI